jgi:arabinogalactan oligomer / maltooligosaccharide transport system permease protein
LSVSTILFRIVGLALIDAVALAFGYGLVGGGLLIGAVVLGAITLVINVAFLTDRLLPIRWISPGLLLLTMMVVYPLLYTFYIAFTNYGQGHVLAKEQVIARFEGQTFSDAAFTYHAYRSDGGDFLIWLSDPDGAEFLGDAQTGTIAPVDRADPRFGPIDAEDNLPESIDGYQKLSRLQVFPYLTTLSEVRLNGEIDGAPAEVRIDSLDSATLGQQKYTYDAARDVLVNNETGVEYTSADGFFTAPDGTQLAPGFATFIGPDNFIRVLTDQRIQGPFFGVFIWTFAFAALTVVFAFAVGLALALVLNDKQLPAKGIFRTLTIIPYTIPGFISALVWVGLLNPLYGPVNGIIEDVIGTSPRWFQDGNLAKVALLLINTWLGYPYMLLVSLGALQSIPTEIYEAAHIDGASPFQRFRTITFPLLLVALAPLLIGAFAFNFNNFTLIELVTEGGPPTPGAQTPAGQTDILISYSYRLAFSGGRGQDYALAAAISIVIFLIVAAITLFNFRLSRRVEQIVS